MHDLEKLFKKSENIITLANKRLQGLYNEKGLIWSYETLRGLKGDVYCKVLGAYLQRKLGVGVEIAYEAKLTSSGLRADILINDKVCIESKAMGIYSIKSLQKRCHRLSRECPDIYQMIIGWQENRNYVKRVRKVISRGHHFWFKEIETGEYQKLEFDRFISLLKMRL